jgi:RNA polymerase sigma-70 factor (ECF subfamily)
LPPSRALPFAPLRRVVRAIAVPIALSARAVYIASAVIDRALVQRLMTAAADGDRTAVEPLFQVLWPMSVDYATKLVGDRALAEDCVQDALVKLFAQVDQFDRERDGTAWALALVTWQARTIRKQRERRREDDVAANPSYEMDADPIFRTAIDEVLASIPARDRDVILASIVDDDALRDTLAPATFRKRLERALSRLRLSWRSRHGTL